MNINKKVMLVFRIVHLRHTGVVVLGSPVICMLAERYSLFQDVAVAEKLSTNLNYTNCAK